MKRLLVLDIDETLFHAMDGGDLNRALKKGFMKDRNDYDFEILDIYPAIERPGVHNFLHWAFENFEVGIWSSAGSSYIESLVQQLIRDPQHGEPLFIYDESRCVKAYSPRMCYEYGSGYYEYIKDLKKLKKFGFKMEDIIVVDDSPEKLQRQYGNLVRVEPFLGDRNDRELSKLMVYLEWLKDQPNIRKIEKRGWDQDK